MDRRYVLSQLAANHSLTTTMGEMPNVSHLFNRLVYDAEQALPPGVYLTQAQYHTIEARAQWAFYTAPIIAWRCPVPSMLAKRAVRPAQLTAIGAAEAAEVGRYHL